MAQGQKNGNKKKWEQQLQDYVRSTAVLIGRAMVHPLGSMVHFWDYGPRHDITRGFTCQIFPHKIQRDPKGNAKKNGCQMAPGDDIFSQLAPILRSAGTSEVRLVLNAVWTRARPMP